MIYDWKKYGLSRSDFTKYREYFLKTLEKSLKEDAGQGKSVKQKHDKSFKEILSNKKEMAEFLNKFIGLEVNLEELEEQKNNYINKQFEKRESDILYKIKNKDIYILVEHQSKVEKRMPRRIFEYCMGIMMAIEKTTKEDDGSNPIIVPIVIYTGANKWGVKTNFTDTQKMLLEKCKTKEELKNSIVEIVLKAQDKEKIEWIKQILNYVFNDTLGDDANKILDVLEKGEI